MENINNQIILKTSLQGIINIIEVFKKIMQSILNGIFYLYTSEKKTRKIYFLINFLFQTEKCFSTIKLLITIKISLKIFFKKKNSFLFKFQANHSVCERIFIFIIFLTVIIFALKVFSNLTDLFFSHFSVKFSSKMHDIGKSCYSEMTYKNGVFYLLRKEQTFHKKFSLGIDLDFRTASVE